MCLGRQELFYSTSFNIPKGNSLRKSGGNTHNSKQVIGQFHVKESILIDFFKLWLCNHWMLWLALKTYRNYWETDNHGHKIDCHIESYGNIRVFKAVL